MKIQLTEFYPVEGKTKEYQVFYEQNELDGFSVESSPEFTLTVHHIKNRKMTFEGNGSVDLIMHCDRCLKDVKVTVEFSFERELDAANGTDEDGEPVFLIEEDELLVDDLISEEVSMNLPMKVLCREKCKGICPDCGADLNKGECDCGKKAKPTKMAEALMQFQHLFSDENGEA